MPVPSSNTHMNRGGDVDAGFILSCIGRLYELKMEYELGNFTSEQIKICHNSFKTQGVIIRFRSKIDSLLIDDPPASGRIDGEALRYMDTLGTQLFNYLYDGSYSIDNSM